jgi:hypothetical protein
MAWYGPMLPGVVRHAGDDALASISSTTNRVDTLDERPELHGCKFARTTNRVLQRAFERARLAYSTHATFMAAA